MSLILLIVLPFAGSIAAALLPANARKLEAWLAGIVALSCALAAAPAFPKVLAGGVIRVSIPWLSFMGLDFSLRMDGYAWLFVMLVSIMGALIILYARYYMSAEDPLPRFFAFFLAFMGSMLGIVLSGNLIQMVVFWEMTSLSSFMLIAYWHHRLDARRGARMSLIVTAGGGLCLLAGVLMLGHVAGSYELDQVLGARETIVAHPWYAAIVILTALGALTKSAQFPFHIWLPNAMAAPTPVSAYLHSATMVKAGVFLLARLWPVLAGTDLWFWIIGGAGMASLLLGAYAATFQEDMKGVLAYSTISHLGLITLLLGMNSDLALIAAIFHMMNHATFKSSLFMAAGIVDHETGTRDLTRLSGLYRVMPITATLALVAAAAMAGVPLLNGFISKEMFLAETIFISGDPWIRIGLPLLAVAGTAFSVAYSIRFIGQVFFGKPPHDLPHTPHEPPRWMLVPSALLVLTCLVVGILPRRTVGPFLDAATRSILGHDVPPYSLKLWHGFTLPFAMSLSAMAAGVLIVAVLRRRYKARPQLRPYTYRLDGRQVFERLMEGVDVISSRFMDLLSSGRLQSQVLLILIVSFLAALIPLWGRQWFIPTRHTDPDVVFALLWLFGGVCAIGAARMAKYRRVACLLLAGGAGLCTCLTFAWLSAPDLALTQLAVEFATVMLILLGLRWLPSRIEEHEAGKPPLQVVGRRIRDLAIAIACGTGVALLAYAIFTQPRVERLASFFIDKSLPLGGGANVVNVILVDFRSFDTLGEITVLGIVALSVFALLRRFRPPAESMAEFRERFVEGRPPRHEPDPKELLPPGVMQLPAVLVRLLMPMAGMVSIFFLLRGHNLPGGGFVGGLIMAITIILQYMVGGVIWVEARPRLGPQTWLAFGLIAAGSAAISAWAVSRPFLTALSWTPKLPLIGPVPLSSVLLFDVGVYMLVVGATVLILIALAHQSLRLRKQ